MPAARTTNAGAELNLRKTLALDGFSVDTVAKLRLADLTMDDVEKYNRHIVAQEYSASQVRKRIQIVRAIIDRAGRQ